MFVVAIYGKIFIYEGIQVPGILMAIVFPTETAKNGYLFVH